MSLFLRLVSVCLAACAVPSGWAGILEERAMEDAIHGSYVFRHVVVDRGMVQLYIRGSVVEIRGQAADEEERALILDTIATVVSPLVVTNRLFVDSDHRRSSDRWLSARLRSHLQMFAAWDAQQVDVAVQGAVITLRGSTPTEEHRAAVEQYLRSRHTARTIRNELVVAPVAGSLHRIDDASVSAMVRGALRAHSGEFDKISVTALGGEVTLAGTAASASEREEAGRVASAVRGVKRTLNQLQVALAQVN